MDILDDCSPCPALSLWPPKLPSLPRGSGGAADPPAAAGGFSEVLAAPSHCHSSAQHTRKKDRTVNYMNTTNALT